MAAKDKSMFVLIIFLLCGIVIGGLIGQLTAGVSWLNWLSYGKSFGIASPIVLNLGVVNLTFALTFDINVASIVGIIIAIFIYKKF